MLMLPLTEKTGLRLRPRVTEFLRGSATIFHVAPLPDLRVSCSAEYPRVAPRKYINRLSRLESELITLFSCPTTPEHFVLGVYIHAGQSQQATLADISRHRWSGEVLLRVEPLPSLTVD